MTANDVFWALIGWETAILFRLILDVLLDHLDRRKARRARANTEPAA